MKKLYTVLISFLVLASACIKTESDDTVRPTAYRVDGITDIELKAEEGYSTWLLYDIPYIGPYQETVTLSFEGLPSGVIIDTNTEFTALRGIPSFTAAMYLEKTDTADMQGTYNIKLVSTGSVSGKRYYNTHLKIGTPLPPVGAEPEKLCRARKTMKDDKNNDIEFYSGAVTIHGFDGHDWTVEGNLDCDGLLAIGYQNVSADEEVDGGGIVTFTGNAWRISGIYNYHKSTPPYGHYTDLFYVTIPL